MFSSNSVQTRSGPDLEEIQTEALGFLALAGESKLKLLPKPWPPNALPAPTSSLLSIASRKGILAAAGPDLLVLELTDTVRGAFTKDAPSENNVKSFSAHLTIPIPRVTQVAFTSDEKYLTLCAEEGGGMAIYDVQSLMQGKTSISNQMATNGISIRVLLPNPAEEYAHILAIVLAKGQLMLADLKGGKFVIGQSGPILQEGVSCVAWSAKGKQLVAGREDGVSIQLKQDGSIVAQIPKPLDMQGDQHVSSIFWLNNDIFLLIHTLSSFDTERPPDSTFTLVTRQKGTSNYVYQKLADPCPPFGMNRSPPHHFISRLRNFPPNLTDVLLVSSTASADVGLFTSSTVPLSRDFPAEKIADNFTTTSMAEDGRRAQLPVNDEMVDTSPVGMALDLSSTDYVKRPIPAEELEMSTSPLPVLMILNNEGVLSSWWFVYNDSVKQKTTYPGLTVALNQNTMSSPSQLPSTFGHAQTMFGNPSSLTSQFVAVPKPSFGTTLTPTFGAPSAFGSSTALGAGRSVWGSQTTSSSQSPGSGTFGPGSLREQTSVWSGKSDTTDTPNKTASAASKPAFGPAATLGSGGFGSTGSLGARTSPWASMESSATQSSAFGMSGKPPNSFGSSSLAPSSPFADLTGTSGASPSPFSNLSGDNSASSPFANFSKTGPSHLSSFGSAASNVNPQAFSTQPSFGSTVTIGSSMGVSSFGGTSTLGSNKSPWRTPGLSTSISDEPFGKSIATVAPSSETEMATGEEIEIEHPIASVDVGIEKRTSSNLFRLPASGPDDGTNVKQDAIAEGDIPKIKEASLFGPASGVALEGGTESESIGVTRSPAEEQVSADTKTEDSSSERTEKTELGGGGEGVSKSNDELVTPSKQESGVVTPKLDEDKSSTPTPPAKASEDSHDVLAISQATAHMRSLMQQSSRTGPDPAEFGVTELPPSSSRPTRHGTSTSSPLQEKDAPQSPASTPPVDLGDTSESHCFSSSSSEASSPGHDVNAEDAPLPPDFITNSSTTPSRPTPPLPAPPHPPIIAPSEQAARTPVSNVGRMESNGASQNFSVPVAKAFATIDPPTVFNQPSNFQESPRSPSPVRKIKSLRSPSPRRNQPILSTTTPTSVFYTLPKQHQSTTPQGPPPFKPTTRSVTQPAFASDNASANSSNNVPQSNEARSEVILEIAVGDEEDEKIRDLLNSVVQPSKGLEPFLAHQDYVRQVNGQGIPTQIEKVYRDMCSMVDTLGLNSRSVQSWVMGQSELIPEGGRDRQDLEYEDTWCMIEIEDLIVVERQIETKLEIDKLDDVEHRLAELYIVERDSHKQQVRLSELRRALRTYAYSNETGLQRAAPLSTEQSSVLADLRKEVTKLQAQLADAEGDISILRAKMAAHATAISQGQYSSKVPTAEAVANTLRKMTAMFEKKGTDIDILGSQLRRLDLSSKNSLCPDNEELNSRSSVRDQSRNIPSGLGVYALQYSSDSSGERPSILQVASNKQQGVLFTGKRSSVGQVEMVLGPADKKSSLRTRLARRKHALSLLKGRVWEDGSKVTRFV